MTSMTTSASPENPEPPYALWRYGSYVGNDIHVVVHLFSHSSLEVEQLCKKAVDAEGNADLSALFGMPVETSSHKKEATP